VFHSNRPRCSVGSVFKLAEPTFGGAMDEGIDPAFPSSPDGLERLKYRDSKANGREAGEGDEKGPHMHSTTLTCSICTSPGGSQPTSKHPGPAFSASTGKT
jgi:hypothetical protein